MDDMKRIKSGHACEAPPRGAWPAATFRELRTHDLDELASQLRHADVRYLALGPRREAWRLSRVCTAGGILYAGRMGAATTGFGAVTPGLIALGFRLGGAGKWLCNGREVDPGSIFVRSDVSDVCVHLDPGVEWVTLCLSEERFLRRYRALTRHPVPRAGVSVHRAGGPELERLRHLVRATFALARAGELGADDWQAFEEVITHEFVGVLEAPSRRERPEYRRLIARCNNYLAGSGEAPVAASHLCEALDVRERTLRRFFRATYGRNPAAFLRLRQLHAARRALSGGGRERGAITRVATSLGFFELGRFAVAYKAAMGESPSETLRRARAREVSENA